MISKEQAVKIKAAAEEIAERTAEPYPQCPKDWMSWSDKLLHFLTWWVRLKLLGWMHNIQEAIYKFSRYKVELGLYVLMGKIDRWALDHNQTKAQDRWKRRWIKARERRRDEP